MGGRGAFYGGTAIFKRHEFYVYSTVGNIKVIRPVDRTKEPKTPTLSHTPNAIYATVRSDGVPKQVTVYGPDREKMYDIDLDHNHSTNPSFSTHVHYYDRQGNRDKKYESANREQRRLRDKFVKWVNIRNERYGKEIFK